MNNIISAISTPYGKGGIAVIRISGEGAITLASKMFRPFAGSLVTTPPNNVVYGQILYNNEVIDDGLAAVFHAPNSFTGEDTVEISCHGGILLTQKVLESTFLCGATPATAGEFTKRAFINGKLGLSQAEAIIDLIDAESDEKLRLASAQSQGILGKKIKLLSEKLISFISSIYVYADYPDEDLSDVTREDALKDLIEISREIEALEKTYKTGKAISQGVNTVIFGKPNTGKSSLLNRLMGEERAIVTDIAGTTRDTIEETVVLGKVILRLCDTAGLRDITDNAVEQIGVVRTLQKLNDAELVLAVFDGSDAPDEDDMKVISKLDPENTIIIINKSDLIQKTDTSIFSGFKNIITLSAFTGEGIETLVACIEEMFISGGIDYKNSAVISNARQHASLCIAREHIQNAIAALQGGYTPDIAGIDLELAVSAINELDGRSVSEEIVSNIFSRFCVGK